MSEPIRVGLVDDQQLVRAGFRMVIDSQPDLTVVAEAGDGDAAVSTFTQVPADVVLMDVRMPGTDGLTATKELARLADPPRIIVLTTFDLDEYVLRAIKAGASGFLLKDAPPEEMLSAIRTVHAGDAVIAPSSTRRLIEFVAGLPTGPLVVGGGPQNQQNQEQPDAAGPAPEVEAALASLTEREREVLLLMARGRTNGEIQAELVVAEATVKTHVGRVLAKLGVRDRVQAVVLAYEAGLVRPGYDGDSES
ncbi:response regulator [Spongisporangium articulatum]|uniref:Response regulator n=1 Tax=Spongisporangium articulatum TaxID=3362603 RepID=A0ABW8ALX0_9ACTN